MFLTQTLHRQLQQRPHAIATVDDQGRRSWSEFVVRVSKIAAGLDAHGVRAGDRVGVLAENSSHVIEHAFACPWAGAVVCPINFRWAEKEMAAQIEEAEIGILFAGPGFLDTALRLRRTCPSLHTIVAIGPEHESGFGTGRDAAGATEPTAGAEAVEHIESWVNSFAPVADARRDPDELAVLMYTGGTTGTPKGVMLSARNILTSATGVHLGVGLDNSPQRHLTISPLFHLAALGNIYAQSMLGSTLVQASKFDPGEFARIIEDQSITSINVVPTMIARLLDHLETHEADLRCLTIIGYGAEAIAPVLVERLRVHLPDVELSQRYGMTETGPSSTILTPADHRGDPSLLASVGRAGPHAEMRIIGPDEADVAVGEVGEIVVRGDHVMLGYWKRPEETARTLRGGWMHTGDAGRLDSSGYLFLSDRIKDVIITGGENVYSAEVEKVISRHPAVSRVAVIGLPDPEWGERVHAVVVPEAGRGVDLDEIRDFAADHLARYKLPRSLQCIDALPLSAVGKVLKRTLREDAVAPPTSHTPPHPSKGRR